MQRLHFDDYASGDVNGRVIAEMGANGYTPQQIAECLGDLTGYKEDSGISLQEYLMRNLKPSTDGQDIIYMDGDKEKILDVGCGSGNLLDFLFKTKKAICRGIEISQSGVNECVKKGLSVIQGDANYDLDDYPNNAFSTVILSQTIQAPRRH